MPAPSRLQKLLAYYFMGWVVIIAVIDAIWQRWHPGNGPESEADHA